MYLCFVDKPDRHRILNGAYGALAGFSSVNPNLPWRLIGAVTERDSGHQRLRAYELLIKKFDDFVGRATRGGQQQTGLIVHDRSSVEGTLQSWTNQWRVASSSLGPLRNLADVPMFADSRASRALQAADLVAYALYADAQSGYQEEAMSLIDSLMEKSSAAVTEQLGAINTAAADATAGFEKRLGHVDEMEANMKAQFDQRAALYEPGSYEYRAIMSARQQAAALVFRERAAVYADQQDFAEQVYFQQQQLAASARARVWGDTPDEVAGLLNQIGAFDALRAKHFGPVEETLSQGQAALEAQLDEWGKEPEQNLPPATIHTSWALDEASKRFAGDPEVVKTLVDTAINASQLGDPSEWVALDAKVYEALAPSVDVGEMSAQRLSEILGNVRSLSSEALSTIHYFGPPQLPSPAVAPKPAPAPSFY